MSYPSAPPLRQPVHGTPKPEGQRGGPVARDLAGQRYGALLVLEGVPKPAHLSLTKCSDVW
jgi:hypothetical protein